MTADAVFTWPKDQDDIKRISPGVTFATVDPGADGMAMVFAAPKWWKLPMRPMVMERIRHYKGASRFARRAVERSASVMVIERAFVGKSPGSGIKTSRTGGHVQGAFSCVASEADLYPSVVEVSPQTWQSATLGAAKSKKRDDRKAEAVRQAEIWMAGDKRWKDAGKEQRSAIADALGMAQWWVRLHYPDTGIFDGL